MTALVGRRRRRSALMFTGTVLVIGAVSALGWVGVKAIGDSTGGRDVIDEENLPIVGLPSTPTGLLLTNDGDGRLTTATVFVLDPSGVGGSIISVPVSSDIGLADDARQSLQGAYAAGGFEGEVDAVQSLLGITINVAADLDPARTAAFLAPVAPINVDLPNGVPATTTTAGVPAGESELNAEEAAIVLTAEPSDPSGLEATRRPDVEQLWVGVVGSIGGGRVEAPPGAGTVPPESFDDLATRLFAGPTFTRGLPTVTLTSEQNPTEIDVEQLDRAEEVLVFASISPGAMSPSAIGPTFRLEAPPGYDAAIKSTIEKILFLQGNIVSVKITGTPQVGTVFYVPDDIVRASAEATDQIFGDVTFGEATERIDGVDITIVLGTDYLERAAS